jgi:hypothetical protein
MAIQEITIWLSGRKEYESGLSLIRRYSQRAILKRMLEIGETEFNRAKMIEELIELNRSEKALVNVKPAQEQKILTDSEYEAAPTEVREIKKRATELFKTNARRHAQLCNIVQEALRLHGKDREAVNAYLKDRNSGIIANEILDADEELSEMFFRIDHWRKFGELPSATAIDVPEETDVVELIRQRNNLRCQVSKKKKKPGNEKAIKELQIRIDALQKQIDALT